MQDQKIVTYVVNLRNRADRRAHILNEFNKRGEFVVEIVPAIEQKLGSVGLWMTIRYIVENAAKTDAGIFLSVKTIISSPVNIQEASFSNVLLRLS